MKQNRVFCFYCKIEVKIDDNDYKNCYHSSCKGIVDEYILAINDSKYISCKQLNTISAKLKKRQRAKRRIFKKCKKDIRVFWWFNRHIFLLEQIFDKHTEEEFFIVSSIINCL